jgi:glucose-1-phosphate thymidylyltransferase
MHWFFGYLFGEGLMKGIILAGGSGTRLYPLTAITTKSLLPVYNKPLIYYPLSVLMLAGIMDIMIISNPEDKPLYESFFGDGSRYGIRIVYQIQEKPNGLAEAFILGEYFIGDSSVCMILGDNIFYGTGFTGILKNMKSYIEKNGGAYIVGYKVRDPRSYGVVEIIEEKPVGIEEKPEYPKSDYAVTGLYFYDYRVVDIAKSIKPSGRGELEITDVNQIYMDLGDLNVHCLGRGFAWLDAGTFEDLFEAGLFVRTIEKRHGSRIACLEEIAFCNGWITGSDLENLADRNSVYDQTYFQDILRENP